ncbi:MAG: hypothetical protein CSA53_05420 [Gammaproteobacteria bacterium]|nr:MAG: hypothetical protein CSA53_05420 [Gammaproteobacteria bacterium]
MKCSRGFSLLELLVVMLVITMMMSLANLGVSSGGRDIRLKGQLESLAALCNYVLDEAQATGIDRGLYLAYVSTASGERVQWQWLERQNRSWQAVSQDRQLLSDAQLPDHVDVSLLLDDQPAQDLPGFGDVEAPIPQLQFFADGETIPGSLVVRERDSGRLLWEISWDLLGRFELIDMTDE